MELDKSGLHKEVIGPYTGKKFTIRRVRFKEFIKTLGTLPVGLANTTQAAIAALKEQAAAMDTKDERKMVEFYISKGVVTPKVWFGDENQCPEDQYYFEDLGSDLDFVAVEIVQYSHEMAGLKDFESFFRGSGTGTAGPDGEEVRTETVAPTPEESIQ